VFCFVQRLFWTFQKQNFSSTEERVIWIVALQFESALRKVLLSKPTESRR
jgi:hypothetical protein